MLFCALFSSPIILASSLDISDLEDSSIQVKDPKSQELTPNLDSQIKYSYTPIDNIQGTGDDLLVNDEISVYHAFNMTLNEDNSLSDTSIVTIYGEMSEGERKEKFFAFEDAKKAVLIATDCISEGIDLQYMSSQLVHYELPWNPNRLEQRNGRIDRYGQLESEVFIRMLVMEDPLDAAILRVLIKKAEQIRRDYGFSPPFFGDEMTVLDLIHEANLDISFKTQTSLFDFQEGKTNSVEIDPFSDEVIQRIRGESFYGQSKLNLTDVQNRLEQTRKLFGSQAEIERFITSGLRRFNTEINEHDNGLYDFVISSDLLLAPSIKKEMRNSN